MSTAKKLKLGLVGGGPGSFIGAIHLNGALWTECLNWYVAPSAPIQLNPSKKEKN
jgi:hypothetical protein